MCVGQKVVKDERFECRTLVETYIWFQDYALEHGYIWGDQSEYYDSQEKKGSVSDLLEAIAAGKFTLTSPVTTTITKTNPDRVTWFRCRTVAGTRAWFQDKAAEFGYIYGRKGAINQLLEAIVVGEVGINGG